MQVLLERVNSHVEVNVIDTGEGISLDFLPFVFDRFRQPDSTTTRRHGGPGLGLAIVKQLVEMHGGSIRAKSLGIGEGANFFSVAAGDGGSYRSGTRPASPPPDLADRTCDFEHLRPDRGLENSGSG